MSPASRDIAGVIVGPVPEVSESGVETVLGLMQHTVELRQATFKGWGGWSIHRGPLEIILVPQVGGRIMGLVWRGDDLFFTHPDLNGVVLELDRHADAQSQKQDLGFPLWGGDKTWIAPQSRWPQGMPYLDLDSGPYEMEIHASGPDLVDLSMTSSVCRESGLRVRRRLTLTATQCDFVVVHQIENAGELVVEAEVWDVTMLLSPGIVYLPTWKHSNHPEGVKTFDAEGDSVSARSSIVMLSGGHAIVDCRPQTAFKFGVDGPEGWIAAVLERPDGGLIGYRKSVPVFSESEYSHGCVAEVYKSDAHDYLELELHGPLISLMPGERFGLEERHSVSDVERWPQNDAEVRAIFPR